MHRKSSPESAPRAMSERFAVIQPLESRTHLSAQLDSRFGAALGDASSIAYDRSNALHRAWRDTSTGHLMYAVRQSDLKAWSSPQVIDNRPVGGEISVAIDSQGRPAVAYSDATWQDLLVARLAPDGTWAIRGVDKLGDVGDHPAITFTAAGKPYVTYHDATNDDLKLAWTSASGKWVTHRLDSTGDVGAFSSIQLEPINALIRVAYADNSNNALKLAKQNRDGTFQIETIDAGTPGGVRWISLANDGTTGRMGVSYYDVAARDLKFAEYRGNWTTRRIATQSTQGEFSHLNYVNGVPTVAWFNRTLGTVNTATRTKELWSTTLVGWSAGQVSAAFDRAGKPSVSMLSIDGKQVLTPGNTAQPLPDSDDASARLVEWKVIGGSTTNASNRRVGWNIKSEGWSGFVNTHVKPLQPLGMERLFLHNPFGTLAGQVMQFDQFLEAKEAGLQWLTNGFVEAFKPLTDAGMEVIGYLGSLPHDSDFIGIEKYDDYLSRVKQSIQPLIDAGMSVAFDFVVSAKESDWAFQVVQSLRDSGVTVYAENRPPALSTYWHSHATIHVENLYHSTDPARNASQAWAATNQMLAGEVLRWVGDPTDGSSRQAWQTKTTRTILADGDTAMIDFLRLKSAGYTPQSILAAAKAQAAQNPPLPEPAGPITILPPDVRLIDRVLG